MSQLSGSIDRRSFLQTFMASAAGVTAMGAMPIRTPAAWVSWEPPVSSLMVGTDPTPGIELDETVDVATGTALGDPGFAVGGGKWVAWTEMTDGDNELIHLSYLHGGNAVGVENTASPLQVEAANAGRGPLAYQPQVLDEDVPMMQVRVIWVEWGSETNRLVQRLFSTNTGMWRGDAEVLREAPDLCRPALVRIPNGAFAVWEERDGDTLVIRGTSIGSGEIIDISDNAGRDCRRPTAAVSPDSRQVAVAYDVRTEAGHNVHLALLDLADLNIDSRRQVTYHPASDIAPALAYSPDGARLWIGWHSNRGTSDTWDIPRWYRLVAMNLENGDLLQPTSEPRDKDLEKRETDQGFEFISLVATPDGGVWVIGRPSHNWVLQKYHGDSWSPLYRLPNDAWGGRGKKASVALDADGVLWVARRDLSAVRIDGVGGAVSEQDIAPALIPFHDSDAPVLANIDPKPALPSESDANTGEEFNIYFGDIHGHTYMSDGMGDVDEYFLRGRDLHQDDFMALTDHDNFVGQRVLNSEYMEQKAAVKHYHSPGNFVTLYAQEWTTARTTSPTGYGHINFYSANPDHPMMDHLDERWNSQAKVQAEAKRCGMICGPHHVAWTGVRWDEFDPEVTQFVEMCSVHGVMEYSGNEPIPHRGGMFGNFVQDGLARGLKFAFTGSTDQHGLIWHHRMSWKRNVYRAGLLGILAPELSREAIFDAIAARRTFATTGVKIRPGFRVNGAVMGSEITCEGAPQIHIDIVSPYTDIRWVEIVRSNETIYREGGVSLHTFLSHNDEDCPVGEEVWYYLRVILEDNNMAWSSPIWVTRTA